MRQRFFELEKVALIVTDMQNDFCANGGYYSRINQSLEPLRKVIPNIQRLVGAFRKLERPVIYTAAMYEPDGVDLPHNRHKILPGFAKRGKALLVARDSWGAEIIDELKPRRDEYVVKKRRFSAFYNTDLETILRCRKIETIILTGIVTYICVEHIARDAFIRDFDVIVVGDAVAGRDDELHRSSLKSMGWSCALIATTEGVIETLNNSE